MLLGTVGELTNGTPPNLPGTHSQLEKQCVACHMQTAPYQSPAQPAMAGHSFKVTTYEACAAVPWQRRHCQAAWLPLCRAASPLQIQAVQAGWTMGDQQGAGHLGN